jgi:hypothetical protein
MTAAQNTPTLASVLALLAVLSPAACMSFGSSGNAGAGGATGAGGGGASPGTPHKLLLRDEAQSMVSYVEIGNPVAGWHVTVPYGRDLQLVGNNRFMIGTDNGWEERSLADGSPVVQQTAFPGTLSAHRLRNGLTVLAGVNWQGSAGVVLAEVDATGAVAHTIAFPTFSFVRLVRQTQAGTFLVTVDDAVIESDAVGNIVWRANVARVNQTASHVWQALRLPTGDTVVSTGYAASIEIFDRNQVLMRTISGPADVVPNQFVGFEILPGGNYLVANWLGHSGEVMGVQLLEYDPEGALVWSYRPDPATESLSLHHVIVLDYLDPSQMYVDDTNGLLVPVAVPPP